MRTDPKASAANPFRLRTVSVAAGATLPTTSFQQAASLTAAKRLKPTTPPRGTAYMVEAYTDNMWWMVGRWYPKGKTWAWRAL